MRRRIAAAAATVTAATVFAAATPGQEPSPRQHHAACDGGRPTFAAHWLGESFEGDPASPPIERCGDLRATGPLVERFNLAGYRYAGCADCERAVEVQTRTACDVALSPAGWRRPSGLSLRRGVPTAAESGGRTIDVYTGSVLVRILGATAQESTKALAALRRLGAPAGAALLAPVRGAVDGTIHCGLARPTVRVSASSRGRQTVIGLRVAAVAERHVVVRISRIGRRGGGTDLGFAAAPGTTRRRVSLSRGRYAVTLAWADTAGRHSRPVRFRPRG